jgi:hypothetical protein
MLVNAEAERQISRKLAIAFQPARLQAESPPGGNALQHRVGRQLSR